MGRFSKLVGMAKESYQDQKARESTSELDDKVAKRAAKIKERGEKRLGHDGIFDPTEDVLASVRFRGAPPQLSDDKVNKALGGLHDKLIDDDVEVSGEGDAQAWVVNHHDALIVLTDRRLMILQDQKVLGPHDILIEAPLDRIEQISFDRSMKGNKVIVAFKDESSVALPTESQHPEIMKVKFDQRPLR